MEKILMMQRYGNYCPARKDKTGLNLELDDSNAFNLVNASNLVPYGLPFNFGGSNEEDFGIVGYLDVRYKEKYANRLGDSPNPEDYGKINLDITLQGLERKRLQYMADYIFVDNFESKNMDTFWGVSGRAQLMIENLNSKRKDK
jgi:hypothetical protein